MALIPTGSLLPGDYPSLRDQVFRASLGCVVFRSAAS